MDWMRQSMLPDRDGPVSGPPEGEVVLSGGHNVLPGVIEAVHRGLTRFSVRLVTGHRTRLRVRWPDQASNDLSFLAGQKVTVRIPADAVCLEAGLFRQGRRRWNRWIGRVVLVQRDGSLPVVTVKLHGDEVILKSVQPRDSQAVGLQTWDTVNVVVDPSRVSLHVERPEPSDDSVGGRWAWHADRDARIWLRARLTDIRQTSEGQLLSLDLGGASISAQIAHSPCSSIQWVPGERIDVQVGAWEAWIKRAERTMAPVPCRLLHLGHSITKASS
ncbi:MAG: hypothetical protein NW703_07495 [Nitrospiraceae bacterium]